MKDNIITQDQLERISYLSPREYFVFNELATEKSVKEIAAVKGNQCSIKTIESHLAHLKTRLNLKHTYEVRMLATRFSIYLSTNKVEVSEGVRTYTPRRVFTLKMDK